MTLSQPKYREDTKPVHDGFTVWRWPEFQAFAARLGIDLAYDTTAVTVRIAVGERPVITQEYKAREPKEGAIADIPVFVNTDNTVVAPRG